MEKFPDEKIVHDEELFAVEDPSVLKQLLHRSIGAMTFLNRHKKLTVGNGTLISPDLVLTAAHNVFDRK